MIYAFEAKLLFGNLSVQHGCLWIFIVGIVRYFKIKRCGYEEFRHGLGKEDAIIGMVISQKSLLFVPIMEGVIPWERPIIPLSLKW
ncbi:MAG: hypothetical protein Q8N82_03270 [Deltaproteobacteria bacterium]|nr:hypothetical protein [Deltaproteobacteria bacterium]